MWLGFAHFMSCSRVQNVLGQRCRTRSSRVWRAWLAKLRKTFALSCLLLMLLKLIAGPLEPSFQPALAEFDGFYRAYWLAPHSGFKRFRLVARTKRRKQLPRAADRRSLKNETL